MKKKVNQLQEREVDAEATAAQICVGAKIGVIN